MIMANTLREKLNAGAATMGMHFLSVDPDIPEIIGNTGLFDYGEYCAEYSAFDIVEPNANLQSGGKPV